MEQRLEENVNKVVSFGIGAFETARAGIENLLKNLETEINALIAQGESDQSENAVKIRSAVTNASQRISSFVEQAKAQYKDLSEKAQKALADLQAKASELAARLPGSKQQAA
jgi:flagellar capping protein FliD